MKTAFLFITFALASPNFTFAERAEHRDCYAEWNDMELTIGNSLIERKWSIKEGLLTAISFKDKGSDTEWLRQPSRQSAPFPGGNTAIEARTLSFSSQSGKLSPVEAESLVIEGVAKGAKDSFSYRFQVFPGSAGVTMNFSSTEKAAVSGDEKTESADKAPDGIEQAAPQKPKRGQPIQALEDLMLSPLHLRYTQVELLDQTDHNDELVFEREWLPLQDNFEVPCNVFHVEDALTGGGLIFLKLAPLPHARPVKSPWDIRVAGAARRITFAGPGYPWTVLGYSGGRAGRIAAMQDFQRCLRAYEPKRDGMFLSNT